MPIMAANGQSDARGSAWLLAVAARDCLEHPSTGPDHETALNNAYRLLESYRDNLFFAHERKPHGQTALGSSSLARRVPSQSHLSEVRSAIQKAIAAAFGAISSDDAIAAVEDTLKKIAYPNDFGVPEGDLLQKSKLFFQELQNRLQAV